MAYIGTQPLAGQYRKLDDISSGFNGATTSFTTSVGGTNVTAGSPQQLLVSLGGVIQQPTVDYTVNTSTITFTTAPASGLSFFAVLMGDALNTSVPADGSITSAKLAGSLSVGLAAGSASTPSLFFTGDTNTGIYSPGADQVAISTGGTQRLAVDTAATTSTLPVVHPLGAVGTPSITFTGDLNTGIWSPAADTIAASTGGSERARIDSSGRLLVGTSNYTGNSKFVVAGLIGGDVGLLDLRYTGSRPTVADITVSEIRFGSSDLTANTAYARIIAESDGASSSGSDIPGRLVFSTTADGASSPTERMRIRNNGQTSVTSSNNLGMGGAGYAFLSENLNNSASGVATFLSGLGSAGSANNTNCAHFIGLTQGVGFYYLYGNGTSSFTSDVRKKKNIETTRDGYLDDLARLRVVKYNWINQADGDPKELGLIAQEVEEVFPGLVQEGGKIEGDDFNCKVLKGSVLPFMLLKALQEAAEKIEALEAKVAALEAA